MHGNEISYIKEGHCDLVNWVKVTKILSTRSALPTVYLCKFGQNPSIGSKDNVPKRSYADADADADADGIRTKNNMSPPSVGGHNLKTVALIDAELIRWKNCWKERKMDK